MRAGFLLGLAAGLVAGQAIGMDQDGFVEDFTTLDRDRWFVSDGWSNGPHQSCQWSARAVNIQGGVLRLSLDRESSSSDDYICAEIQSEERFGYGAFEAVVRIPFASGTNSNFFTFIGPPQNQPHNEIDFEFIARTGPTLQTNTYVEGTGGNEALTPVADPDDWHEIAFIWEPDRLRWFLDGILIRDVDRDKVPDLPQKIYLSTWSTTVLTDWLGPFQWDGPLVFQVDRVSYTPLGAECRYQGSILCGADLWSDSSQLVYESK